MVNKAILIGNAGADPDVRATSGGKVARFSLATSEYFKDKNTGQPTTKTEWHQVQAWGTLAEVAEKRVRKGSTLYVEGPIRYRSYEDRDGVKRNVTEINALVLRVLSRQEPETKEATAEAAQGEMDDLPY